MSKLLFLVAIAASLSIITSGYVFQYPMSGYPCQQWSYQYSNTPNKIVWGCTNYQEREGACPTNCIFDKDCYDLSGIKCEMDSGCPVNYKCCQDPCYMSHKICKPIVRGDTTTTKPSTTSRPTTTTRINEIPTAAANGPELEATLPAIVVTRTPENPDIVTVKLTTTTPPPPIYDGGDDEEVVPPPFK